MWDSSIVIMEVCSRYLLWLAVSNSCLYLDDPLTSITYPVYLQSLACVLAKLWSKILIFGPYAAHILKFKWLFLAVSKFHSKKASYLFVAMLFFNIFNFQKNGWIDNSCLISKDMKLIQYFTSNTCILPVLDQNI